MESKNFSHGQLIYIFEFEIVPGKEDEFWLFMEEDGTRFWLEFPEIESYEIYSKLGGQGGYEARVVVNNFAFMDKMYGHPQAAICGKRTAELTQNVQRRFLRLAKVYVN